MLRRIKWIYIYKGNICIESYDKFNLYGYENICVIQCDNNLGITRKEFSNSDKYINEGKKKIGKFCKVCYIMNV